jgi:hypothetical protein
MNYKHFQFHQPRPETKAKLASGKVFSVIITDPVRRFAYILASEEGYQRSSRSVQMFEVRKAVRYSFHWTIVEIYGKISSIS